MWSLRIVGKTKCTVHRNDAGKQRIRCHFNRPHLLEHLLASDLSSAAAELHVVRIIMRIIPFQQTRSSHVQRVVITLQVNKKLRSLEVPEFQLKNNK